MVFQNYNNWRNHPKINALTSLKDLKYVWPGFGWGLAAIGIYITCEQLGIIKKKSHGKHDHHDSHH
eukprot:gene2806-4214_t